MRSATVTLKDTTGRNKRSYPADGTNDKRRKYDSYTSRLGTGPTRALNEQSGIAMSTVGGLTATVNHCEEIGHTKRTLVEKRFDGRGLAFTDQPYSCKPNARFAEEIGRHPPKLMVELRRKEVK